MNKTIFLYEFRKRIKSILTWSVSILALIAVFFSIFPSFSAQTEVMNDLISRFPPELLTAFGMSNINLATVTGYFSLLFVFCQLLLAIQAANYGFGLVSIEENELTADFLLTKPVSRQVVLNSKALAAFVSLLITNAILWAGSYLSLVAFAAGKPYDSRAILLMLGSVLPFQLFFFCVGLVVSLLVKRVRSVTPYSLGLAFGAYILNAFSGVFNDVKLEYLTPFRHFDAAGMIQKGTYNWPLVGLDLAVIVVSLAASYWLYLRRDIPAAS